jgi:hypothetical protein
MTTLKGNDKHKGLSFFHYKEFKLITLNVTIVYAMLQDIILSKKKRIHEGSLIVIEL